MARLRRECRVEVVEGLECEGEGGGEEEEEEEAAGTAAGRPLPSLLEAMVYM